MVCKECGKEITDETLGYCPECLAPLDEPVVISMTKDDIKKANKDLEKKERELQKKAEAVSKTKAGEKAVKKKEKADLDAEYEGPFINLIGFVKSLGSDFNNLLIFIGAVLLYISPFMPWIWETLHKVHRKGNLFDIAGKTADMSLKAPVIGVMGVLILVSGFMMLLVSAREYIKPLWKIRNNFIVKMVPALLSVIAVVLVFMDKNYKNGLAGMKELKDVANSLGQSSVYSYGRGLGPILCIAGIAIYVIAVLLDYLKNKSE